MEVDLIFKIAAIGILVAVLNQLLIRSGREEQGLMVVLAGSSSLAACRIVTESSGCPVTAQLLQIS